jgi:hypothetical protein
VHIGLDDPESSGGLTHARQPHDAGCEGSGAQRHAHGICEPSRSGRLRDQHCHCDLSLAAIAWRLGHLTAVSPRQVSGKGRELKRKSRDCREKRKDFMPQPIVNGRASAPSGMGARSPPGHHRDHAAICAEAAGAQLPVEALGGGARGMVEVVIRGRGRAVTKQGQQQQAPRFRRIRQQRPRQGPHVSVLGGPVPGPLITGVFTMRG